LNTIHKTQAKLWGYQAVLKPSKYGYSLHAVIDSEIIPALEAERAEHLEWCRSHLKYPKRRTTPKPEPWEEIEKGQYRIKFSWNEQTKPTIYDDQNEPFTDTRLYSDSVVNLAFFQKPYILKDYVTYGTTLKLVQVQVVEQVYPVDFTDPLFPKVVKTVQDYSQ